MSFLITGANGFIGNPLCAELTRQNFSVKAAARNFDDFNYPVEKITIPAISQHTDWSQALSGVEIIIHLAARVHVIHDKMDNPLAEFLEVNLHGTVNLARQAAEAGVRRFVYVSSIKVNGEQAGMEKPFTESDTPQPQDAYADSKWQAEQALHAISQKTGMEIVIVRPPLVYGPGVKANFAHLLRAIDCGMPLAVRGIRNSRSLIYVGNLVDALIACAIHPAAAGQTYLVSDGEDLSTPQLARALAYALHKPGRIFPMSAAFMRAVAKIFGMSSAVDRLTQSLVVDSSKIRSELGWQPPYSMAQGLQVTAKWYLQLRKR